MRVDDDFIAKIDNWRRQQWISRTELNQFAIWSMQLSRPPKHPAPKPPRGRPVKGQRCG
jgi:hypothetical protein